MKKTKKKLIQFYGALWCGDCLRSKDFFEKHKIEYKFHDTETESEALEFVKKANKGSRFIPTLVFPDGSILVEPSNEKLTDKLGIEI